MSSRFLPHHARSIRSTSAICDAISITPPIVLLNMTFQRFKLRKAELFGNEIEVKECHIDNLKKFSLKPNDQFGLVSTTKPFYNQTVAMTIKYEVVKFAVT